MTKITALFAATSMALAASSAAYAAEDATATLRVDRGNVMVSQGGEFTTASSGQVLVVGGRLMVSEDSSATVTYDNDCTRQYTAPGVYVIEATCEKAIAPVDLAGAAKVAAGVVIGGAFLNNIVQDDSSPVSR